MTESEPLTDAELAKLRQLSNYPFTPAHYFLPRLLATIDALRADALRVWPSINRRRGELVDKEIGGTITSDEAAELARLQEYADHYVERTSPRPTHALAEARHDRTTNSRSTPEAAVVFLCAVSGSWPGPPLTASTHALAEARHDRTTNSRSTPEAAVVLCAEWAGQLLFCDLCGGELQREACNHVRPCPCVSQYLVADIVACIEVFIKEWTEVGDDVALSIDELPKRIEQRFGGEGP